MSWTVAYDPRVAKDLRGIAPEIQLEILEYLENRIAGSEDPRKHGKPLRFGRCGLWRYLVRDYRILCELQSDKLIVLVVTIAHRSTVYR
ncbi:MAG: type II toxin-antitoxin system RelE/ParE family toxin [Acidobacteriota bacterium]